MLSNFVTMDNSSVKNNIFKLRKERGLSQEEMAQKMNISITAYRKLEKGKTAIISERLFQLSDILGVPEADLVLGYKSHHNDSIMSGELNEEELTGLEYAELKELRAQNELLSGEVKTLRGWLSDKEEIIQL